MYSQEDSGEYYDDDDGDDVVVDDGQVVLLFLRVPQYTVSLLCYTPKTLFCSFTPHMLWNPLKKQPIQ